MFIRLTRQSQPRTYRGLPDLIAMVQSSPVQSSVTLWLLPEVQPSEPPHEVDYSSGTEREGFHLNIAASRQKSAGRKIEITETE